MAKPFYFITLTGHVSEKASLASLVNMVRAREGAGIQLVDYDEESRRVVLRFSPTEVGFVKTLLGNYIDSAAFEVKAKLRGRLDAAKARKAGGSVERTPKTLLALIPCPDGLLLVEQKGRELLVKYCSRPAYGDFKALLTPSTVPPSLCSFNPFQTDILDIFEKARDCVEKLLLGFVKAGSHG